MKKFIEPANILMIDIETLDVAVTAQVVEVAMIYCNLRDESSKKILHTYVELDTELAAFFTKSKSTLKFHMENNTMVLEGHMRACITDKATKMSKLISTINALTSSLPDDTMVYCFGLNFDIPVLNYTAQQTGTKLVLPPYGNLRCLRTELATAEALGFTYEKEPTAHNALEDCHAQLELLHSIFDFYKELTNELRN